MIDDLFPFQQYLYHAKCSLFSLLNNGKSLPVSDFIQFIEWMD